MILVNKQLIWKLIKIRHNDRQNIVLYSILCIKSHFIIVLNFQIWEKPKAFREYDVNAQDAYGSFYESFWSQNKTESTSHQTKNIWIRKPRCGIMKKQTNVPLAEQVHDFSSCLYSFAIPPWAKVNSVSLVIFVTMPSYHWQIFRLNFADIVATLLIMILASWRVQSVNRCKEARQRDI